jgi:hypothetical protein
MSVTVYMNYLKYHTLCSRLSPIIQSIIVESCVDEEALTTNLNARPHPILGRHSLDRMNIQCPQCSALHWKVEKLSNSSVQCPFFGTCCLQGKVRLPQLLTPPPEIQVLYDGDDDQSKSF